LSFTRYAQVVAAVAGTSLVLLWPLAPRLGPGGGTAAAWGAALAVVNALAAYRLVLWSRDKTTVAFFRAILGGMIVRMALLLVAVAVALGAAALPVAPFLISLLGHFVVFLVLETAAVSRMPAATGAR
jgi:O-antigen/teichoic acid export membrane protein